MTYVAKYGGTALPTKKIDHRQSEKRQTSFENYIVEHLLYLSYLISLLPFASTHAVTHPTSTSTIASN